MVAKEAIAKHFVKVTCPFKELVAGQVKQRTCQLLQMCQRGWLHGQRCSSCESKHQLPHISRSTCAESVVAALSGFNNTIMT